MYVEEKTMNTKLTLNLNASVIEKAKIFAKNHRFSLSKLVENYFQMLTEQKILNPKPSNIVAELTGVVNQKRIVKIKDARFKSLMKKYS